MHPVTKDEINFNDVSSVSQPENQSETELTSGDHSSGR